MDFGQAFKCHICKKELVSGYHRFTCNFAGIDMEFYTCQGKCDEKFRSEYVEPFIEQIETRFEILDL